MRQMFLIIVAQSCGEIKIQRPPSTPPPTFSYWLDSSTGLLSLQKTRYRSIQIPRNQILGFEVSRQLLKLIKEKIVL